MNGSKVFVGGLSWETSEERLRAYFENFGEVTETWISYDRQTSRPRGFGFVVFANASVAERVCATAHTIDRREVEAKPAVPRDEHAAPRPPSAAVSMRKFFIGGLAPSVDEPVFRRYFERFGVVEDAVVMYDHDNRRPRGFGFVTFGTDEAASACKNTGMMQTLHDKPIEIKLAVPPELMPQSRTVGAGRGRGAYPPQGNGYFVGGPAAPRPPTFGAAPYPDALVGRGYGALGGMGALGGNLGAPTRLSDLGYGGGASQASSAVSAAAAASSGALDGYGGGALLDGSVGAGLASLGLASAGGFSMESLQGALPQRPPARHASQGGSLEDAYAGAFGGHPPLGAAPAHTQQQPVAPAYHSALPLGDGSYGVSMGGSGYGVNGGAGELGGGGGSFGLAGDRGGGGLGRFGGSGADGFPVDPAAFQGEGGGIGAGGGFHAAGGGGGLGHELVGVPVHTRGAFSGGFHDLGLPNGQQW